MPKRPLKVVVTGGAGFIGSHLSDALLRRGHEVICVDDLSKGTTANLAHLTGQGNFGFKKLDIRDLKALQAVGRGCDVVVHLAAAKIARYESALNSLTLNLEGAHAALELARENKAKFVLGSTSDVYGKSPDLPFREDADLVLGPSTSRRWAYAVTKLCDEHMAYAYQDEFGLPVTILRFFGAYGERQYLNWWGGPQGVFLEAIATGQPIEIHGDGNQTRCFIHVDDLAEGIARAVERDESTGEIVNLGTAEEISVLGLAQLMHELSGVEDELKLQFVPYSSFTKNYEDVRRRVPDMTKMHDLLGFKPQVDLRVGLSRLWRWYRTRPVTASSAATR
jgi:UDP-glucose 4-epimerase